MFRKRPARRYYAVFTVEIFQCCFPTIHV
jgi:hypothetical protein